jgi:hypothetical protein
VVARRRPKLIAAAVAGGVALALLVAEGALYLLADKIAQGVRSTLGGILLLLMAVAIVGGLFFWAAARR